MRSIDSSKDPGVALLKVCRPISLRQWTNTAIDLPQFMCSLAYVANP